MKYRIYADGSVCEEPDFQEYDHAQPYYDDYVTCELSIDAPFGMFDTQSFPNLGDVEKKLLYEHIKENNFKFLDDLITLGDQNETIGTDSDKTS